MTNPTQAGEAVIVPADHVVLCIYEKSHGTFYTLGSRVLCGPFTSPTGRPVKTYKISIAKLKEIIEYAERTGDTE